MSDIPYTLKERWFMWKSYKLFRMYEVIGVTLLKLGFEKEATAAFDRGLDHYESGWECSQGM